MPIIKASHSDVADKVLYHIRKEMKSRKVEPTLNREMYANGREQGYSMFNDALTRRVSFAECRNSDSIRVYFGGYHDFDNSNIIRSDLYDNGLNEVHFDYGREDLAAKWIVYYLVSGKIMKQDN